MFPREGSDPSVATVEKDLNRQITALGKKIDKLEGSFDNIRETNERIIKSLDKIEEGMYNPDNGLYARIKEQDARIDSLEKFEATTNRWVVFLVTSFVGVVIKLVYDAMTGII